MTFQPHKIHIVASHNPLEEGLDYIPLCQRASWQPQVIRKAAWRFMWDTEVGGLISINPDFINCCRFCQKLKPKGRYVYGIQSGQELQDQNHTQETP